MSRAAIGRLVILGGGTAGWLAAAILARALGRRVEISLVESAAIGTVGVGEATIPQIRLVNRFLGLDEDSVLRASEATFKLGIEFHGWRRPEGSYIHAFGGIGIPLGTLPFYQYWLRRIHEGGALDLRDFSLNAVAARAHRFLRRERWGETPLPGINYAYHFDATLYARFLRRHAEGQGVRRIEGRVVDVEREGENGFLRALLLEGGERVAGDFFLDCSGFRGLLIAGEMGVGFADWSDWLPCDRAVAVGCARTEPLLPYTQAIARPAGWQWRIPLQHRIGNGHVYASAHMSDDEATAILMCSLDGKALGEPRLLHFKAGMREAVWEKNCLALGLASGFLEPLESTSIHLIQSGLERLLDLFPDRHCEPHLVAEYNRRTRVEFESVRDFLILHYYANGRPEPFWRERAVMHIPPELAERIALFRASGRIHRRADELFTEASWLQVLVGQGIIPEHHHPFADALTTAEMDEYFSHIRTLIDRAVAEMPEHADYIARHCAAIDPPGAPA